MSRFRKYVHSLISGYALLGANILFTLFSVPLALHYLSREEFGLWALVTQVCNFNLLLIDLGMSGSLARILIDHKDDRTSPAYGTVIQTGFLVLVAQGVLIAGLGTLVSFWLPEWMAVPAQYWRVFRLLVSWQCVLLAVALATRIFIFILQAHQRYDVCNYSQLWGVLANFLVLWAGFEFGLGLYSLLAAAGASTLFVGAYCLWAARQLDLFPARDRWGRPNATAFQEMFSYGMDIFLLSVGQQLIAASQVPIITRALGPEVGLAAAATWSVATKIYTLAQQVIFRLLDFSAAAFSEMMARGERARLLNRFRDIVILSGSLSVAIGLTVAVCNRSFLDIWTQGQISWGVENDVLMAISLIVYSTTRCHVALAGLTKQIGVMKFVCLAEGVAFVGLAFLTVRWLGFAGVILSGILTNMIFSGSYGLQRTTAYFNVSGKEVLLDWLRRPAAMLVLMIVTALPLTFVTQHLASPPKLALKLAVAGIIAFLCFWRAGMPETMRAESSAAILAWLRRWRHR